MGRISCASITSNTTMRIRIPHSGWARARGLRLTLP
jgi:hypothetical protein